MVRLGSHAFGWLTAGLLVHGPAIAQRTGDNAVESAEDAFGRSVGDSSIGIYGPTDVRGFSPTDAGNFRIEGLYYDEVGTLTGRVNEGSAIRVGISAQNYPFPAPTGIVDFLLRRPGAETIASVLLSYGPRGGLLAELDLKLPIDGDRLGVAAGIGFQRDRRPSGGTLDDLSAGLLVRFAPRPGTEVIGFMTHYSDSDNEAQPLIFTGGRFLPARYRRGPFCGQDWNDFSATAPAYGVMARTSVAGFDLRFGAFRSVFHNKVSTADLLFGAERDRSVAQRIIVRERDNLSVSNTGELRVSRTFREGPRQHMLIAMARGREARRRYGGAALVDLGPSAYGAEDDRPEPVTAEGPKFHDRISQHSIGLAYQGRWRGIGELGISLQRNDYRKRVTDPDPNVTRPETRSAPWLPSATMAFYLSDRLALYGGFTRGLEESAVAPLEAVNRNEAPPAIRTEQVDAGLRWAVSPGVNVVAGGFRIRKPYFNLDAQRRFRQLGAVTNRGVELSLAGTVAPGLTVVAGAVLLDATISGEEVDRGLIGSRPIGTFARHLIFSANYRLPFHDRLSLDVAVDSSSRRVANAQNSLFVPARATVAIGGRYRFRLGEAPVVLRAQVQNLTNEFGWNVGRSGYFTAIGRRSFSLSLTADL